MIQRFLIYVVISFFLITGYAQTEQTPITKLPVVEIKNVKGEPFSTKNIENNGKPIIITFWATWCKPCMKEHDAINEVYDEWVEETGVKLYAVSIDNSRSSARVLPTVNGKGWKFDVLLDDNSDFKRAMNVNVPPHTFVLDGSGNIVWQHVGYLDGDEAGYIETVKNLLK